MTELVSPMTRRSFFTVGGLGAIATLSAPGLATSQSFQLTPILADFVAETERQANVRVVDEFCASFLKKDLTKAASLLDDNAVYRVQQNSEPIRGRDAVVERVKGFMNRPGTVEFRVFRSVAFGPLVLNERVDLFTNNDETRRIYIAGGMFFLQEEKIVEWTDYVAALT